MRLVIHDLKAEEWEQIRSEYDGDTILSDNGAIRPCIGCFSCWNRTPGQCVVRDGYENMGALIHQADEIVVISRYTYGGFSGFVKNIFDRSLGYVLPQFEIVGGETHHKKRYKEDKPFTFLFYGHKLSEKEKESARRYVTAVCANIRGHVKAVIFQEREESEKPVEKQTEVQPGKVILLNGSMRSANGNSARLAQQLVKMLHTEFETVALQKYIGNLSALLPVLEKAEAVVLCTPLYVDGLPSQVIRLLETAHKQYNGRGKRVYVLANMGLYESQQLVNLFSSVKQWCEKTGHLYCGGLGISAGELIGVLMQIIPFHLGPSKKMAEGMRCLAEAIDRGGKTEDIYAEPYGFPRSLYIRIANSNWNRTAKKNGISPKDLYRRL